jgi:hypothetical protein
MLIVSQNKEKIFLFGMVFNSLEYAKKIDLKGKTEHIRHTICISDGWQEELAEYKSKERCLEVLKDFCEAYKNELYTLEFFDVSAETTRPAIYRNNTAFEFPKN